MHLSSLFNVMDKFCDIGVPILNGRTKVEYRGLIQLIKLRPVVQPKVPAIVVLKPLTKPRQGISHSNDLFFYEKCYYLSSMLFRYSKVVISNGFPTSILQVFLASIVRDNLPAHRTCLYSNILTIKGALH